MKKLLPNCAIATMLCCGCSSRSPFAPIEYGETALRSVEPFDPNKQGTNHGEVLEVSQDDAIKTLMDHFTIKGQTELSIADVRRAALANNLSLQVSFYDPQIASETLRGQQAKFESTFSISASRQKTVSPTFNPPTNTHIDTESTTTTITPALNIPLITGGAISLSDNWESDLRETQTGASKSFSDNASLSISQPLMRNAGEEYNTASIQLASYQYEIATAKTTIAVINTIQNAEFAYWNVYKAWHNLEIQKQQYNLYNQELEDARTLYETNKSKTLVDLYAFETDLAQQAAAVIQADNGVRLAIRKLKVLINESDLSLGDEIEPVPTTLPDMNRYTFDTQHIENMALTHRLELLQSEFEIASDVLQIKMGENQLLPELNLQVGYQWYGFDDESYSGATSDLFSGNNPTGWQFGITGSFPIGNEVAKANLQAAMLKRLQSIATKQSRELTVRKDVHNALDNLNASWMTHIAALYQLDAAQKNHDGVKRLYKHNQVTSTTVTNAIMKLGQAKITLLQSEVNYQLAMVQLAAATGTLMGHSQIEWTTPTQKSKP
jgi:outer membrane protein TolC